ncbi:MAG: bL17 family ribosomal protein [Patescibacteria group bacterium]
MKRTLRAQSDFKTTLLRNQLTSLVLFESVTTTKAKAKQLIPFAERFFSRVQVADMNAKRLANQTLFDANAALKVFEEILPRYNQAETTFLRSFRVIPRHGDSAEMMMVTFTKPLQVKTPKVEKTEKVAPKKPTDKKAK